MPGVKEVVQGPTGIAFGYDDPIEPARAISEFVKTPRLPLQVRGAVMGDQTLTPAQVENLAQLPSKDQLISKLMAQIQGPITGLVYVLNAPIAALARVLQRAAETGEAAAAAPVAESSETAPESTEEAASAEEPEASVATADPEPEESTEPEEPEAAEETQEEPPEAAEPEAPPDEPPEEAPPEESDDPAEAEPTAGETEEGDRGSAIR